MYQEHPTPNGAGTTMLVMADSRGNQATIAQRRDVANVFEYDDVYGAAKPGQTYPHPDGDRGIAAITTTAGGTGNGYLRGTIGALPPGAAGALSGLLGNITAGPVVHVVHATAAERLMPTITFDTEIVLLVVRGLVTIGPCAYHAGELRVQRSDAALIAPLVGARTLRQLEDNIAALALTLDAAHLDLLDAASRIDLGFPHDFLQYPFIRDGLTAGTVLRPRS